MLRVLTALATLGACAWCVSCAEIGGFEDYVYAAPDAAARGSSDGLNEASIDGTSSADVPIAVSPALPSGADGDPILLTQSGRPTSLFVRGTDRVIRFGFLSSSGSFVDAWQKLGIDSAASNPCVGLHADGSRAVFARTTSGTVVGVDEESDGGWTAPRMVAPAADSELAVDDRGYPMAVLARAGTDLLVIPVEGDSGAPTSFAGTLEGNPILSYNEDGRAEVFARAVDGTIVHQWQDEASGPFTGVWATLPGTFAGDPAVFVGSDLLMVLAVVDRSGVLQVWKQGAKNAAFVEKTPVAGPFEPSPVIAESPSGTLVLAVRTPTGDVQAYAWSDALDTFDVVGSPSLPPADSMPSLGFEGTKLIVVARTGEALDEATCADTTK
jgi:hypothetical protein